MGEPSTTFSAFFYGTLLHPRILTRSALSGLPHSRTILNVLLE
jgi:hypothetical protein